ncbi:hypothetical protein SAMN06265348_101472 [Pedobacter westerhofensis]|uniref:Uncharacterized protein n=1 Tax=Pedobacter westerhofensis TaxID=425512 RepID=A0A521AUY2_9SPHI|nr:hypothetical protein [Pedobacter westerhofensis]SMO38619.1 hypothetical protein SAMN06265348_101472 [Pedobacter westerhofensis]
MSIISINPANGKKIKEYAALTEEQAPAKIKQTHNAWLGWKTVLVFLNL